MISKRIGIAPKNDNYARLAAYIADAGHNGEKSLMSWCTACFGGEEYAEGIAEVQDVQSQNVRTAQAKTYHLVVSFRQEAAGTWQNLHAALAVSGMEIKPHGNGLVVKARHSEHAIKASALDRSLSQKRLEAHLGPYCPPQSLEQVHEASRYEAAPLSRSPERGKLFMEYQAGVEARKATLQGVKEQEDAALAAIRAEWAAKLRDLEKMNIAKRNRRNLLQLARKHEAEALAKAKLAFQEPREAVRREVPYTSWNGFLLHKAEQGSEVALTILRSTTEAVEPERPAAPTKDWSTHGQDYAAKAVKAEQAEKERAVLEINGVSGKGKNRLQAVLRMEQLAAEHGIQVTHRVDGKGAVVFSLPGGGTVRDTGKGLFFTAQDKAAESVALSYARKKWGKSVQMEGNRVSRGDTLKPQRSMER